MADTISLSDILHDDGGSDSLPLLNPSKYYDLSSFITTFSSPKNNSFSLFSTNARSLQRNKEHYDVLFDELALRAGFQFDILTFVETWFDSISAANNTFSGYSQVVRNRETGRGGGVAIYVKDDIHTKLRSDLIEYYR